MANLINIWTASLNKFEQQVPPLPAKNAPAYAGAKAIHDHVKQLRASFDKFASLVKAFDKKPDAKSYNDLTAAAGKLETALLAVAGRYKGATDDEQIFRRAAKALAAGCAEVQSKAISAMKEAKATSVAEQLAAANVNMRLFGTINAAKTNIANIKTRMAAVEKSLNALRSDFDTLIGGNGSGRVIEAQLVAFSASDTEGTNMAQAHAAAHKWNTYGLPANCSLDVIHQKLKEFAADLAVVANFQSQMAKIIAQNKS